MKKIVCFLILIVVVLSACKKPVRYSDIPKIEFISINKYQDEMIKDGAMLTFSFQDGNGDIGLNNNDTFPPFNPKSTYYYNFFCDYYEKQNGVFKKIDSIEVNGKMLPFNLNARIPRLSYLPEESINGEIYLIMPFYYDTSSPYNDTIGLTFYIVDRKLNKSNMEEVTVIRRLDD
jgi:hypothetical protein